MGGQDMGTEGRAQGPPSTCLTNLPTALLGTGSSVPRDLGLPAAGDRVTSQHDWFYPICHLAPERKCPPSPGPLGASSSFRFHRTTPERLLGLAHLVIHLHITFSWVLEEKQPCTPQKVTQMCQKEPDDTSHTCKKQDGCFGNAKGPKGSRERPDNLGDWV